MSEKSKACTLDAGKVTPCYALAEVLQSPGRGTRYQGVECQSLLNMETFKFARNLIVVKSGKHGKNGIVFNFCPFCAGELLEGAADTIQTPRENAK